MKMLKNHYQYLIVGSGAGGSALARSLSEITSDILIVEKGRMPARLGTVGASLGYYDNHKVTQMPVESREGVILWRTFIPGGTTIVSCGNATPCLQDELAAMGIFLTEEYEDIYAHLPINPLPESLLSEGGRQIAAAAQRLGYQIQPMPKFLADEKCVACGQCVLGCQYGAKWTAIEDLNQALRNGVEFLEETRVERILIRGGKVVGIEAKHANQVMEITADYVILAAGGLGTPVLLQNSGIEAAGDGLFIDIFINTYGVTPNLNLIKEPTMSLLIDQFHAQDGFILSPFANYSRLGRFIELGPSGVMLPTNRLIGMMTKIADESSGRVFADGQVSKRVTEKDRQRLDKGTAIARDILVEAGADPKSILYSKPQGAHPGGTAAIGKIVNADLRTEIDGLYVCDSSVLPQAPGKPPILTILALAKRLAKHLSGVKTGRSQVESVPENLLID
jgi:choline dehydrogenase-like flavoprotein